MLLYLLRFTCSYRSRNYANSSLCKNEEVLQNIKYDLQIIHLRVLFYLTKKNPIKDIAEHLAKNMTVVWYSTMLTVMMPTESDYNCTITQLN